MLALAWLKVQMTTRWIDLFRLTLVGLPAWRKTEIQNLWSTMTELVRRPRGGGRSWLGPPLNPPLCLVVVIGGSRGHVLLLKQISACAPDPRAYTNYVIFWSGCLSSWLGIHGSVLKWIKLSSHSSLQLYNRSLPIFMTAALWTLNFFALASNNNWMLCPWGTNFACCFNFSTSWRHETSLISVLLTTKSPHNGILACKSVQAQDDRQFWVHWTWYWWVCLDTL